MKKTAKRIVDTNSNTAVCLALKERGQVGPKLFQQLLMIYGDPADVYLHPPEDISSMTGINIERAQKITESRESIAEMREEIDRLKSLDIEVLDYFDSRYPDSLRKIDDPPLAIYVKGSAIASLGTGGVAIVGASAADEGGIKMAVEFAKNFVERDQTIISGLAQGIDSAAHLGCLKNNGKTIAVLGCGHLNIYPEENIGLANLIAESGAVISEYDIHADAIPGRLVARNRLIAALADIVLIAQIGAKKKGELYAAKAAIEQGKPVYVYDPDEQYDSETLLDNLIIRIKGLAEIDEVLKYIV